jgi:hypothetical protein
VAAAMAARAFVSTSANISKENGYVILKPPIGDSVISKENGYVILTPPVGKAVISKMNAYAVVMRQYPSVQIIQ